MSNSNNLYHWIQIKYNLFRLVGPNFIKEFNNYGDLYLYCIKHNIDAKQD